MSSASIPRPCPPRLTGAVLDDSNLDIVIDVRGYHNLPSTFHDSRICLGLASHGERVLESCFEQVNLYATHHEWGHLLRDCGCRPLIL